jgi:hypothetical protein
VPARRRPRSPLPCGGGRGHGRATRRRRAASRGFRRVVKRD